ncbi:HotDog domain-containing protein [Hyaloscypha finlandica]|nr:HotDog domain-containing protein [Hyaloscypha finlandica]KAH8789512.1 HotDog domain-containing protein [Hyaloscypha sp. PMI_1271]
MAPQKLKVNMLGVESGKELAGIPVGDESAEDRVLALLGGGAAEDAYQGWGSTFFHDSLDFVSATASPAGRTVFRLTVLPSHCNRLGNLHGGCTATVFDICTSTALAPIAKPGYWQYAGVSRGLSVTYLKPVPVGEKVLVDSEVVSAGKRMCVLRGTMRRESDGEVLALCEHGKVSIDPPVSKI